MQSVNHTYTDGLQDFLFFPSSHILYLIPDDSTHAIFTTIQTYITDITNSPSYTAPIVLPVCRNNAPLCIPTQCFYILYPHLVLARKLSISSRLFQLSTLSLSLSLSRNVIDPASHVRGYDMHGSPPRIS